LGDLGYLGETNRSGPMALRGKITVEFVAWRKFQNSAIVIELNHFAPEKTSRSWVQKLGE